jgi:hypothetical protein
LYPVPDLASQTPQNRIDPVDPICLRQVCAAALDELADGPHTHRDLYIADAASNDGGEAREASQQVAHKILHQERPALGNAVYVWLGARYDGCKIYKKSISCLHVNSDDALHCLRFAESQTAFEG